MDDEAMFLDGLHVHLAGCNRAEMLALMRICREGAATRDPELCSAVTHIVVSRTDARSGLAWLALRHSAGACGDSAGGC